MGISTLRTSRAMLEDGMSAAAADERRWRAVLERDASLDGSFVYAVSSTGVYCRPTCPGRPPRAGGLLPYGADLKHLCVLGNRIHFPPWGSCALPDPPQNA